MKQSRNNFYFFWKNQFSQWAIYSIVIEGEIFNCNEQYMMAEKAKLFGDYYALGKIMAKTDPKEQKALGKMVLNFDKEIWNKHCQEIVYRANYAKFTQHEDLKSQLLATGDKIIAEASPYDIIWGIGLSENDPRATDTEQWKGTNWLGEAIMRVRRELNAKKEK